MVRLQPGGGRLLLATLGLLLVASRVLSPGQAASQELGPLQIEKRGSYRGSHPSLDRAIRRQQFRHEYVKLEALIDSLALPEGMTILDIGAGPGYASFLLADRLRGSGHVFATDVRADFVDHIESEAKRRGLENLSAALVGSDGLDEFYSKHRYDLVLLSNVYHCLDNRVAYFTQLRKFLKDGARLVLIMYNQGPLFEEVDVTRTEDIAKVLANEPDDSPFLRGLSKDTRNLLAQRNDMVAVKRALLVDFNRMLTDPQFYRNFYKESYFDKDLFDPPERDFANWLLMTLEESEAPRQAGGEPNPKDARALIRLNRLFFMKRFGSYMPQGGRGAYIPAGDANRHTSKYVMFRELRAAGYELTREFALSAYYDGVVMTPRGQ